MSRVSAGGRELTLILGGPRQLVAGMSAFCAGARHSASGVALEDSAVFVLDADAVRQLTARSPALVEAVLTHFARRHAEVLERMEALMSVNSSARLAAHLLDHTPPGGRYPLPTNSELAALLGTVPELVSRRLGEFYRQRSIRLHRRSVELLDEAALKRVAGRA